MKNTAITVGNYVGCTRTFYGYVLSITYYVNSLRVHMVWRFHRILLIKTEYSDFGEPGVSTGELPGKLREASGKSRATSRKLEELLGSSERLL